MSPDSNLDEWHVVASRLRQLESIVSVGGASARALQRAAELCEIRALYEGMSVGALYMPRVCVESPLRGDVELNKQYADACMFDCLSRREAPFLGHLLYPRVLRDEDPDARAKGITAHCAWLRASHCVAVYIDLGVTQGMEQAIALAHDLHVLVVERALGYGWRKLLDYVRPTGGFEEGKP